ncbi:epoxide hydrolase family protein [Nonomuraea longicatena]|uniref:Epoxide hydrolase n=1 Tax=Nonomuraea longicatena TaxID=83682 RepID=A0ABN1P7D2_9ACTN
MNEIERFSVRIPQADLDDLRERLRRTRWARQLPGAGWDRGVPVAYLRELAEHWADGFDWRAVEARLNAFDHYVTDVDGQRVHFIHQRSPEPHAVPLIMTHSWPNSIVEFLDVIGPLSDPRAHGLDPALAFHVVAPSLPGFGFSYFPGPTDTEPWSVERVARTWAVLMERLGHDRYGAHGNDAGALVTPQLAALFPDRVIGSHITGGLGIPDGGWWEQGSGYGPYLSARPQTLGHGFADSPVAQLAYLVERFHEFDGWTGAETLPRDLVLATASVYWLTNSGATSSWTYYDGAAGLPIDQDVVPTGVSHGGPQEFRTLAEQKNDIRHWAGYESPSHMVAMAVPGSAVASLREFFGGLE